MVAGLGGAEEEAADDEEGGEKQAGEVVPRGAEEGEEPGRFEISLSWYSSSKIRCSIVE